MKVVITWALRNFNNAVREEEGKRGLKKLRKGP